MTEPKKVLITAALLYANGTLHFGHLAGAYLASDCYARFERMQGSDVLYLSGSDEYGVAITLSAELEERTPLDHVNHYHAINKALFEQLNFSFDHYARTTWPRHREPVYAYFQDLLANGYIQARTTKQLYSEDEGRFLADRYVVGICPRCRKDGARGDECPHCGASYEATDLKEPRSRMTGSPLTLREAEHWFLRLDKLADSLKNWLPKKQWKPAVLHFLQHYLDDLRPRAITRDSDWGIPVPLPEAKGKVFYVWFEAVIGYISAAMEWAELQEAPERWKDYWQDSKTHLVHFIGKDNLFFHGLFFPAMTMGQNQPFTLVDDLPANEFLQLEGRQFSKTEGWTIDLPDFLKRYSADQIRYTLAANAPESSDSEFTWADFQMRCNAELVGKYGNLANRTLIFAQRYCDGETPTPELEEEDRVFLQTVHALCEQVRDAYTTYRLRRVCQLIMEIASAGNSYFDAKKPWVLAKDPATKTQMATTIHCCMRCLQALATVSSPVIPAAAQRLWELIGCTGNLEQQHWDEALTLPLTSGQKLSPPTVLFQKIPDEQIAQELERLKHT